MNIIDSIIADVQQGNIDSAIAQLNAIKENNRGHEKLGLPSTVVITYPAQASERVIEAASYYTAAFFGGEHTAKNLRTTGLLCGNDAIKVAPDWFMSRVGHMGRDEFVHLVYLTMVEVDIMLDKLDEVPEPYDFDEASIREDLLFKGLIKRIDDPLPKGQ